MGKRLLFFLLPAFFWIGPVKAEYYVIRSYHVNVTIDEMGEADFEETLEVEFSEPRHGIIRFIPTLNKLNGKNLTYIIKDVRVEGFTYSTSRENNNLVIKIGDADKYVSGRQVYKIHYHVHNPIHFFDDHSEFYWDLVGVSTLTVTEQFTFEVNFPEKVKLSTEHVRFFTGAAGEQQQNGEVQVSSRQIQGRSIEKLMPQEGWTIAVYFPEGTFQKMSSWSQFFLQHTLLLIAPLFVLAGLLGRYIARNRRQTIMTEYFPPPGISPDIAGGFVYHSSTPGQSRLFTHGSSGGWFLEKRSDHIL